MHKTNIFVAFMICQAFAGALSLRAGQTPGTGLEQQLRSQYPLTLVGANGVVVRNGTVLVIQQDGIQHSGASRVPLQHVQTGRPH